MAAKINNWRWLSKTIEQVYLDLGLNLTLTVIE